MRWSARLVLFLLAAGVLLLLGDGRARAAPSQPRSVTVSVDAPPGAPARVAHKLVSSATRAANRRPVRPAGTHDPTADPRRHSEAAVPAPTLATQSPDRVAGHAGHRVGRPAPGRTGRIAGQALAGAARRGVAALAPVTRTLAPILGPVTQPVGDVLDGPLGPVDRLPDLTHRPPSQVAGTSPALARAGGIRDPVRGASPGAAGTVPVAGAGGQAGSLAAAERMAVDDATAGREPGAGKTARTTGIPAIPASAQGTRDVPAGSLVAARLPLLLLLLWSVSFGKDGTRHRARPPLLFPA